MAAALTQRQIDIVKSTSPVLREYGHDITTVFYKTMLDARPELKNIFSLRDQQTGAQQKALANAVLAYATYIDDLPKLKGAVERIAHKHAALFITPEQYDIVGHYLVQAFAEVLGDALTPEIADAWIAAYGQLASVFINREAQLYSREGAHKGWRKFRIAKRVPESESVTSFYFAPSDGVTPLPSYFAGQYVSVQIPLEQLNGLTQSRQYSLSEASKADGPYYRVSVKREYTDPNASIQDIAAGKVPGVVSNILFDKYPVGSEVELSNPQGEFFVDANDESKAQTPLVLLSAGVGATPLVAILEAILASDSKVQNRPVSWVQAARNSANLCFGKRVRELAQNHENVDARIFLDQVMEADVQGGEYDFKGELDLSALEAGKDLFVGREEAEYYICGPVPWMLKARKGLEALGVPRERMHLELFGVGEADDE